MCKMSLWDFNEIEVMYLFAKILHEIFFSQHCEKLFSQNSNLDTQILTDEEQVKHMCFPKAIWVKDRTRSKMS